MWHHVLVKKHPQVRINLRHWPNNVIILINLCDRIVMHLRHLSYIKFRQYFRFEMLYIIWLLLR